METGLRGRVASGGAAVAAAVVLAGCGGSGIPTGASVKEFCGAGSTFSSATKFADGVKAAEKLHDTGTPQGIPADARKGFVLVVDLVTTSKDRSDLQKRYQKLSSTQKKSVSALDGYISKTC